MSIIDKHSYCDVTGASLHIRRIPHDDPAHQDGGSNWYVTNADGAPLDYFTAREMSAIRGDVCRQIAGRYVINW